MVVGAQQPRVCGFEMRAAVPEFLPALFADVERFLDFRGKIHRGHGHILFLEKHLQDKLSRALRADLDGGGVRRSARRPNCF